MATRPARPSRAARTGLLYAEVGEPTKGNAARAAALRGETLTEFTAAALRDRTAATFAVPLDTWTNDEG